MECAKHGGQSYYWCWADPKKETWSYCKKTKVSKPKTPKTPKTPKGKFLHSIKFYIKNPVFEKHNI